METHLDGVAEIPICLKASSVLELLAYSLGFFTLGV